MQRIEDMRASGVAYDVRKARPYLVYGELEFEVPVGSVGDAYDLMKERGPRKLVTIGPEATADAAVAARPVVLRRARQRRVHALRLIALRLRRRFARVTLRLGARRGTAAE